MTDIVIADLGTGNLRSVSKAVEHVAPDRYVTVSNDPDTISSAGHLVLPGQGAIGTWMRQLDDSPELSAAVRERLAAGPVLGICLGLQALYESSEENGGTPGMGLFHGSVRHFSKGFPRDTGGEKLKIPHMGWNRVAQVRDHPLWQGIEDGERFYFVHSYYVDSADRDVVVGESVYGLAFTAAAASANLFAVQFHPEKSQHAGLRLLENFVNWNGVH